MRRAAADMESILTAEEEAEPAPGPSEEEPQPRVADPEPQAPHNLPIRLILYGKGLEHWGLVLRQTMTTLNPETKPENLPARVRKQVEEKGYFFSQTLDGENGQATMVTLHPPPPHTRAVVGKWLDWLIRKIDLKDGHNVMSIVSTDRDYDAIVKMLANLMKIMWVPRGVLKNLKATSRYKEHKEKHDMIIAIARQRRDTRIKKFLLSPPREDDDDSDLDLMEGEEGLKLEGYPQEGSPEEGLERLQRAETRGLIPEPQGPLERKGPLPRLPEEVIMTETGGGIKIGHYPGSAWDLDADALIIITDKEYRPYSKSFRTIMKDAVGEEYFQELEKIIERGETREGTLPVTTSGGGSSQYMIIHLPMGPCKEALDKNKYLEKMVMTLIQGINAAYQGGAQRIILDVNGLQTGKIDWKELEAVTTAAIKAKVKTPCNPMTGVEMIIVISQKQHKKRLQETVENETRNELLRAQYRLAEQKNRLSGITQSKPILISPSPSPTSPRAGGSRRLRYDSQDPGEEEWERQAIINSTRRTTEEVGAERSPPAAVEAGDPMMAATPVRNPNPRYLHRFSPLNQPGDGGDGQLPQALNVGEGIDPRAEEKDAQGSEDLSEDEEASLASVAIPRNPADRPPKDLRGAKRRGNKKPQEVLGVYRASEGIARDLQLGYVETRDGRRTYIPEAGQNDYPYPGNWLNKLDEKTNMPMEITWGEAANLLIAPSYHTLVNCNDLTKKFREGFVTVMYDVMLRKIKHAVYRTAKQELKKCDQLDDDDGAPQDTGPGGRPLSPIQPINPGGRGMAPGQGAHPDSATILYGPVAPPDAFTTQVGRVAPGPIVPQDYATTRYGAAIPQDSAAGNTEAYSAFKTMKEMVRGRQAKESIKEYLCATWPLIKDAAGGEAARKMWIQFVTSSPVGTGETAQAVYERWVDDEEEDEDTHIARAKEQLKQGITLVNAWHKLKQVVTPSRYVKALRQIVAGTEGDLSFVKLGPDANLDRIEKTIREWDRMAKYYNERRKTVQPASRPRSETDQRPPPRPQQQQRTTYTKPQYTKPQYTKPQQQPPSNRPTPAPRDTQRKPPPQKSAGFLSAEDYAKLTVEEKKALRESRQGATPGGPGK